MSYQEDRLLEIANAIRSKKGTSESIKASDFANEILNLSAGSSDAFNSLVDGTITNVGTSDLSGVNTIRNNAFNGLSIENVDIPSNVTTIGDSAFANNNISALNMNEGVTTIGDSAFQNNSISALTIPASVTSIGDSAFAGNTLTEITMESDTPPVVTDTTFPSSLTTTNVSYNGYPNYAGDANWQTYKDTLVRGLAIPSTITIIVNNYLNELVNGASVTITGNEQTYTGTTNENGTFTQGDLQPATYTISVADIDGFKTPAPVEVVVEENTQNSAIITYLEKPAISRVFGENSPAVIAIVANEIAYKNMTSAEVESTFGWKLGDTTSYRLSTGENVEMRIIGFNHDDLSDGSGKAGITLDMTACFEEKYTRNTTSSNAGGYPQTITKKTTLPNMLTTIPQEWQTVIKLVNKKSANGGGSNYSGVVTTSESLFLLSEIELYGVQKNAQGGENEGIVYEYWNGKVDADRVKKNISGTNDRIWMLRSCTTGNTYKFCNVSASGTVSNDSATYQHTRISYAFCVGSASDYNAGGDTPDTPSFSRTFGENTPEQISAVSAEISANNMTSEQVTETYGWNIGDTISYQLTTGENVEMRIVGFNHDDKSDGSGKAGITLEMTHCLTNKKDMAMSSNAGGYPNSLIKTKYLPEIKATLPQEWQNVIKLVNKKSANGGSTNYSQTLTTSEDLFLLATIEIFGKASIAQDGINEGYQYEYYVGKTASDRIKKLGLGGSAVIWWLRSCSNLNTTSMLIYDTSGNMDQALPSGGNNQGVSFAFCV